jgi:hypothetical protein
MIPQIRESAKALLDLTENPETANIMWFAELGVHMQTIAGIYNGEPVIVKKKKLSWGDKFTALLLRTVNR